MRRTGGPIVGHELGVAVVGDPDAHPSRSVRAGFGPAGDAAAVVVDLAADEVGGQDVARRRPPRLVGAEHQHLAGAEGDVQLGEERGGRAVGVDRPDDAVLAAPPPVAQQRTERRCVPSTTRSVTSKVCTWSRLRYAVNPGVSSRSPTRVPLTNAS